LVVFQSMDGHPDSVRLRGRGGFSPPAAVDEVIELNCNDFVTIR
jgi:hypothetical protein